MKNALAMVWAAKNPFNEHRQIFKTGMPLVHPNAYRIFFPFSYIGGLIRDIIHPNEYETRADAWYRFWGSSLGEIILLCIFGLIVTWIQMANASGFPILALDVPSGMDSNSVPTTSLLRLST